MANKTFDQWFDERCPDGIFQGEAMGLLNQASKDFAREAWDAAKAPATLPIVYGCHCDLEPGMSPDGCVLDGGSVDYCVYAETLRKQGKTARACEYWKPV